MTISNEFFWEKLLLDNSIISNINLYQKKFNAEYSSLIQKASIIFKKQKYSISHIGIYQKYDRYSICDNIQKRISSLIQLELNEATLGYNIRYEKKNDEELYSFSKYNHESVIGTITIPDIKKYLTLIVSENNHSLVIGDKGCFNGRFIK